MNIIDSYLPISPNTRPGTKKTIKWIVIHETGNTDKGANAAAHSKYLFNVTKEGKQYVSWHYTVDDKEIYHHIPDDEIAWHAGDWAKDKVNGGNACGIGIELCVNSDGDFNKTMQNGAELVAFLCKKYGLAVGGVVRQHWEFSGKNCPQNIRARGLWDGFLNNVGVELQKLNTPTPPSSDYKVLYEQSQRELQDTKNALLLERSKSSILEDKAKKFQGAMNSIEAIVAGVK